MPFLPPDLYVFYTDKRETVQPGLPELGNRWYVVKTTRMLRR